MTDAREPRASVQLAGLRPTPDIASKSSNKPKVCNSDPRAHATEERRLRSEGAQDASIAGSTEAALTADAAETGRAEISDDIEKDINIDVVISNNTSSAVEYRSDISICYFNNELGGEGGQTTDHKNSINNAQDSERSADGPRSGTSSRKRG